MNIDVPMLLKRFPVPVETLSLAIGRTQAVINSWYSGKVQPPGYIALVLEAVYRRLQPASIAMMHGARLSALIGIHPDHEKFWKATKSFPLAARYAVTAALSIERPYDLEILHRVYQADRYYLVGGKWRARASMGRALPPMLRKTPDNCLTLGYLATTIHNGHKCLVLTKRGKDRILTDG